MLIPCPECGTEVSEKAPTCPKCGVIIGYPSFYNVGSTGLCIESLVYDWWEANLDDSAFCRRGSISFFSGRTWDEEMAELTYDSGKKLAELMRDRLTKLPETSKEAVALKLAIDYALVVSEYANLVRWCFHKEDRNLATEKIRPNLDLLLRRLESIKTACKGDEDREFISSEIESCKKFESQVLAERQ